MFLKYIKNAVQGLLNGNPNPDVVFERFYFAYCKKDPKALNYSELRYWERIDEGIQEIFQEQLIKFCKGKMNEKLFVGEFTGKEIDISDIKPIGIDEKYDMPVHNILQVLTGDYAEEEDYKPLCDMLALKYLALPTSRSRIYGMIHFKARIAGVMQSFVFISLCDLEEEKVEALFEAGSRNLITSKVYNIFEKLDLTKGAMYPFVEEDFVVDKLILFEDREAEYWKDCFECERKLNKSLEQDHFIGLMKDVTGHTVEPQKIAEVYDVIGEYDRESEFGVKDFVQTMQKVGYEVIEEEVKEKLADKVGKEDYTFTVKNIVPKENEKGVKIIKDDVEVRMQPHKLQQVYQFRNEKGEIFIAFKGGEIARMMSKEESINLKFVSWDQFKEIVEEDL